jgi:ATP synthase protein I
VKDKKPAPSTGEDGGGEFRQYLSLSALGIEIGVTLAIGILIGWYLDRLFGTRPWLIIVFSILGIIAGFRNIVRLARKDWDEESGEGDPR